MRFLLAVCSWCSTLFVRLADVEADVKAALATHLRDNLSFELLQRRVRGLHQWESRSHLPPLADGAGSSGDADSVPVDVPQAYLSGSVEEVLIDVLLDRCIAASEAQRRYLAQFTDSAAPSEFSDVWNWWSFTQRFSEQFYGLTTSRVIDMRRFFSALKAKRLLMWRDDASLLRGIAFQPDSMVEPEPATLLMHSGVTPMPFLDNCILHACLQITSHEDLRRTFMLDCSSTDNGGPQAPLTVKDVLDFNTGLLELLESVNNQSQSVPDSYGRFSLRDDALLVLLGKLKGQSLPRDSAPLKARDDVTLRFEKLVTRAGLDLASLTSQDAELFCLTSLHDFRSPCIAVSFFIPRKIETLNSFIALVLNPPPHHSRS